MIKMEKYKSKNIDLVNLKKNYNFKISKNVTEIKNNDIFINSGTSNKDLFMLTNLFFKYNNYKNTKFKKDFIKSMLRITNNSDKSLDLYKNYSHYNVLFNYSNSLYKNIYGIKIPKNLKESKIFNELIKESKINQKMNPIDKITKLSKFVYNKFEYNLNFFFEENVNKIIPLEKIIEKRVGACFEMSIVLFLLIKQDEILKNNITKIRIGELIESSIENKSFYFNKTQKSINELQLNKSELYEELKNYQKNNLKNFRDQKNDILKKLKRIDNKSKKTNKNNNVLDNTNININELDKVDKKYGEYLSFNAHAWVSITLDQKNKKQEYILDPANGGITIPKSLGLILPTTFNNNYMNSEGLTAYFSKK